MTKSEEIIEGYDPLNAIIFCEGESPFEWYDAQVRAINHFRHIFCINPFYNNKKESFYGWEFESTEEMLEYLNGRGSTKDYLNMTIKTIRHLKQCCNIEFPNKWGEQFYQIN